MVFHAQQSVEKLLKARLIQLGQPWTKSMIWLPCLASWKPVDGQWSWDDEELADLSAGAVLARYPGFETSAEEQAELVEFASRLRQALEDSAWLTTAGTMGTLSIGMVGVQTANPIPCIHPAGIARSSRQRIAIGRSPSWLT